MVVVIPSDNAGIRTVLEEFLPLIIRREFRAQAPMNKDGGEKQREKGETEKLEEKEKNYGTCRTSWSNLLSCPELRELRKEKDTELQDLRKEKNK